MLERARDQLRRRARLRAPILKDPWGRRVVVVLCGYEVMAMLSPLPTLTQLSIRSRRVLGAVIVAVLFHHLIIEKEVIP